MLFSCFEPFKTASMKSTVLKMYYYLNMLECILYKQHFPRNLFVYIHFGILKQHILAKMMPNPYPLYVQYSLPLCEERFIDGLTFELISDVSISSRHEV